MVTLERHDPGDLALGVGPAAGQRGGGEREEGQRGEAESGTMAPAYIAPGWTE